MHKNEKYYKKVLQFNFIRVILVTYQGIHNKVLKGVYKVKRTIRKIGNSILVAIPPATLETLGIKVGDVVDVITKNGRIEINKIKGDK